MKFLLLIGYNLIFLVMTSCSAVTTVSGYIPLKTKIEQLKIGSSTRYEVLNMLGEPLNYSNENFHSLVYIQQKLETVAFFKPKVSERTIVNLTFDNAGLLSNIDFSEGVHQKTFSMDKKIVVSEGRKLTFWQQMFGNIGNFSSEQFID